MISIPTSEVKRFLAVSTDIPDTKILPVYGYVKLVCKRSGSFFVKHNGHRFMVVDIEAEFKKEQTLLIEAKPLFGFVKFSRTLEITITPNGKSVKISDGEREISCQLTDDVYPTIDDHAGIEKSELPDGLLDSLAIAKHHTLQSSDKVMRPWTCFVHIRKIEEKWYVIGTRGEVTYFKGFKEELPQISLDPEVVSVLLDLKPQSYYSVGSYDYFESLGILCGFIKPETKCSETTDKVLKNFKSSDSFEISTRPVIDFCEMVNMVSESSVPSVIRFEGNTGNGDTSITAKFDDVSDNIKAEEKLSVQNKTFDFKECCFLPRNVLTVLKGAKKDKVKVSYAHFNFIITSDEPDYIGAIMQLAN